MPRGVARRPGKVSGRPKADPAVVARAIALVRDEGLTCEEAGERVTPRLGGNTVRRAMKAQEAAADAAEVIEAPSSPPLSSELVADVLAPADPDRAAALRLLVVRGTLPGVDDKGRACDVPVEFGADWVERVAAGESLAPRDVRRLLREAAVSARLDALPFELAKERSIAVGERFLRMAEDAHDGRSGLDAQRHIDRMRFEVAPPDPEGLTRAEVTILLRRVASELQGVAGGVEALRRALAGE